MALRIQWSETLSCCFADAYPWLATAEFIGAIIVQGGLVDGSAPAMARLAALCSWLSKVPFLPRKALRWR